MSRMIAALLLLGAAAGLVQAANPSPPPLFIVPGFTSSNLEVSFGPNPPPGCPPNLTWTQIWPPGSDIEKYPACAAIVGQVYYDPKTQTYPVPKDTYIRPIDFGGFGGFGFNPKSVSQYGYQSGKNLFGAPYDWRYAPDGQADFHTALKGLIENVTTTLQRKAVILGESNGPMITLGFLYAMSDSWKQKYMCGFAAVSPVWAGTPMSISYAAEGTSKYGVPAVVERLATSTFPASFWNMPRPGSDPGMYNSSQILAYTPSKNYTAYQLHDFITDLGFVKSAQLWDHVHTVTSDPFPDPGVNTWVTYGYGLDTPAGYVFSADLPKNESALPPNPRTINGDGDSLVPVQSSLRANHTWPASLAAKRLNFTINGYKGQHHAECLGDSHCITDLFRNILGADCSM